MKSVFKAPSGSFFRKEQERVEKLIKDPLLELILTHLPHLQSTVAEQEDTWEIVAIKVNSYPYETNTGEDTEIPTLNGPYVKEVYGKLMKDFMLRCYYLNRDSNVFQSNITTDRNAALYTTAHLPVREILTLHADRILCELYYLKGYDVEVLTKLSKERYENSQRKTFEDRFKAMTAEPADEGAKYSAGGTATQLQNLKAQQEKQKLQDIEKELSKLQLKVEQLNLENKRLLELNHELVEEMQRK